MHKYKSIPGFFLYIIMFFFVFIFSVCPANAARPSDTIRIMPLGDSITYGEMDSILPVVPSITVGYRQKLYLDLVNLGYKVNFVGGEKAGWDALPGFDYKNEGHPGWTDDEIADNIYDWLEQNPADIVLLHIGTNSLDTNSDDVQDILEAIDDYSPEVIVILAQIINRATYSPNTTTFNKNVKEMAEGRISYGDKIVIVDMESALNYETDMADNLHPNESGYEKMADVWLDALLDVMPFDAIGTFRKGAWYLDRNLNDQWDVGVDISIPVYSFGCPGDTPVTGDWDGNGFSNIGVFRNGAWYLDYNGNGMWDPLVDKTIEVGDFGSPGDVPVTGDWNGDGTTNIGVFRNGAWYLDYNGNYKWDPGVDIVIPVNIFGTPGDIPVTGDWNGSGTTKVGVFRKGAWYLDFNGNRQRDPGVDKTITAGSFGAPTDVPVTGDWNGDGKINIGTFRKGAWYLDYNSNNNWDSGDIAIPAGSFGAPDDIPIVGLWEKKPF